MLACEKGDESIYDLQERWDTVEDNDDTSSVRSGRTVDSRLSTASASSTASYLPIVATHTQQLESRQSTASDYFLLLDMRDDEEVFRKYHIEGAMHYPPALLRRDHFPPALYQMRNAPNKLIILYDTDETSRNALDACVLFLQKGFTNTFLLTGGLKHFCEKYLSRVAGEQPPKPKPTSGASTASRSQSLAGTPAARSLTGSSLAASSRLQTAASARTQTPQTQTHSATSLGYAHTRDRERESPRDVLGRMQGTSQQAPPTAASSRSQRGSNTAGGSSQISSRAFR